MPSHYDVITFGSAVRDNYMVLKKSSKTTRGNVFCFPLGAKIEVEGMQTLSGGGGTNSAATFANQGLKTAYVGKVGSDKRGEALVEELKEARVATSFIKQDKFHSTAYSLIISIPSGERTIFVYRGASNFLTKKEIPFKELKKTKWFYLAPFSGHLALLTEPIVDFAYNNNIKVAFNPGYRQLKFSNKDLRRILSKVDVLILNQEEAALLTKISAKKEGEIFRKIDEMVKGIVIVTKGKKGAVAFDGKYLYHAPAADGKVIDNTGAGDSFGSGFVAGLAQGMSLEASLQLAAANAASCLRKRGAKMGLLKKGQKYQKVKIIKKKRYEETAFCRVKF